MRKYSFMSFPSSPPVDWKLDGLILFFEALQSIDGRFIPCIVNSTRATGYFEVCWKSWYLFRSDKSNVQTFTSLRLWSIDGQAMCRHSLRSVYDPSMDRPSMDFSLCTISISHSVCMLPSPPMDSKSAVLWIHRWILLPILVHRWIRKSAGQECCANPPMDSAVSLACTGGYIPPPFFFFWIKKFVHRWI